MRRISWKMLLLGIGLAFLEVTSAGATPIVITNPGFEDPVTTVNNGPITGWSFEGSCGLWNINTSWATYWDVTAPEGNQIAFVSGVIATPTASSISQVLSDTLQANSLYSLTGYVGHPKGFPAIYSVELLAGNNRLNLIGGQGPVGSFLPFELTFDSTGSPYVGQTLKVRLSSSEPQTGFDDIRLNVVPEPATMLLLGLGLIGLTGARRRFTK